MDPRYASTKNQRVFYSLKQPVTHFFTGLMFFQVSKGAMERDPTGKRLLSQMRSIKKAYTVRLIDIRKI